MGKRSDASSSKSFTSLATANAILALEKYDGIVIDDHAAGEQTENECSLLRRSWFELQRVSLLGQGVYSNVHMVVDPATKKQYALKCLDAKLINATEEFLDAATDLARETQLLARLDHENIIQLRGVCSKSPSESYQEDGNGFFFLMDVLQETLKERMDRWRADKDNYYHQNRKLQNITGSICLSPGRLFGKKKVAAGGALNIDRMYGRIETVALGIVSGMRYLHEQQSIVIRDLKPANIGFDASTGQVRLFDFGLSRPLDECLAEEVVGTPRYMSPETMLNQGTSFASDVYSFGVLLYEMCSLKVAFSEERIISGLQKNVVDARSRPSLNIIPCPPMRSLISDCWAHDPKQRPTFEEIQGRLLDILEPPVTLGKPHLLLQKQSSMESSNRTYQIMDRSDKSLLLDFDDDRDRHETGSCGSSANSNPVSFYLDESEI